MKPGRSTAHFLSLLALTLVLVGLLLQAPEDVVLGERMRWVYLHVAFTWAGTSLIDLVGLVGLYLIIRPTSMQQSLWVAPAQASGLFLFATGFIFSLVASQTSWGGILWMEPRVRSSALILVGGILVVLAVRSLVDPRAIGILAIALAMGVSVVLSATGRVFHPDDPIDASDSTAIRMSFLGLTVIAFAIGIVLTMIFKRRPEPRD